jgi:hypothetical protein
MARFSGVVQLDGVVHAVFFNQELDRAPNLDSPVTLEPLGSGRFRFVAPTGGGAANA